MTSNTEIYPAFTNNNIPIVLSSDRKFLPFLSVMIQNILEVSSINHNYDLLVLETGLTDPIKKRLAAQIDGFKNISLRYINMDSYLNKHNVLAWCGNVNLAHATYYRLFMPKIMSNFEKVVYLDIDMFLRVDPAELYSVDLEGYLLAAARNAVLKVFVENPGAAKQVADLGIKDAKDYFNAGVLVFHISEMNKRNIYPELLHVASTRYLYSRDQDVLNAVCYPAVLFLDYSWNVSWSETYRNYENTYLTPDEYDKLLDDAKILHFLAQKPTFHPQNVFGSEWFQCARKTPFYEHLLLEAVQFKMEQNSGQSKELTDAIGKIKQLENEIKQIREIISKTDKHLLARVFLFFERNIIFFITNKAKWNKYMRCRTSFFQDGKSSLLKRYYTFVSKYISE